jgi:glycosyltransferase involved in cell wall biosynthesis
LIIVDDGSSDNTEVQVKSILGDSRIRYIYQENKGVSAARNSGVSFSTGKYITFLDSDDIVELNWLSDFEAEIQKIKELDIILGGFKSVCNQTGIVKNYYPKLNKYNPTLPGTFLIKKKVFSFTGGYDEQLKYSENTELFLRLSELNFKSNIIQTLNLIHFESPTGESKNLDNISVSIDIILSKHSKSLNRNEKWNLLQTLGVIYLRKEEFVLARKAFFEAIIYRPYKVFTFLRMSISFFPAISRRIYSNRNFQVFKSFENEG